MVPLQSVECIKLINTFLNKDTILLEVGSGGSTIDFSKKVKKVYSIEHDKNWYKNVSEKIKSNNLDNIDYVFVEPNIQYIKERTKEHGIKFDLNMGGGRYWEYKGYANYIEQIGKFDTKFDVCFIDGQARMHCYLYVLKYLTNNGIVIIHDFYNVKNVAKHWHTNILLKYYDEIASIKKIGKDRGNDVIILRKKINVAYDEQDLKYMDNKIPRF